MLFFCLSLLYGFCLIVLEIYQEIILEIYEVYLLFGREFVKNILEYMRNLELFFSVVFKLWLFFFDLFVFNGSF